MKKLYIILISLFVLMLSGCSNVSQEEYDAILEENSQLKMQISSYDNLITANKYLTDIENDHERITLIYQAISSQGYDITTLEKDSEELYNQAKTSITAVIEVYSKLNSNSNIDLSSISFDTVESIYQAYEEYVKTVDDTWPVFLETIQK